MGRPRRSFWKIAASWEEPTPSLGPKTDDDGNHYEESHPDHPDYTPISHTAPADAFPATGDSSGSDTSGNSGGGSRKTDDEKEARRQESEENKEERQSQRKEEREERKREREDKQDERRERREERRERSDHDDGNVIHDTWSGRPNPMDDGAPRTGGGRPASGPGSTGYGYTDTKRDGDGAPRTGGGRPASGPGSPGYGYTDSGPADSGTAHSAGSGFNPTRPSVMGVTPTIGVQKKLNLNTGKMPAQMTR